MMSLPHRLDRTVTIRAPRESVVRFFTDTGRWAAWWGTGSSIDARPGGAVRIRYPEGTEVGGEVIEIRAPEKLVFTYGYVTGKPIPPGNSRVTILLEDNATGTILHLTHEFADAGVRDQHVQGWRFQLSLFANAVANEVHAGAASVVDSWFKLWSVADEQEREKALAAVAVPNVRFRDQYSLLEGMADLLAHIGASQRFMPGIHLERKGGVRHCQGTVLADWIALATDGREWASGTSVFQFSSECRIESVTGVRNPTQ